MLIFWLFARPDCGKFKIPSECVRNRNTIARDKFRLRKKKKRTEFNQHYPYHCPDFISAILRISHGRNANRPSFFVTNYTGDGENYIELFAKIFKLLIKEERETVINKIRNYNSIWAGYWHRHLSLCARLIWSRTFRSAIVRDPTTLMKSRSVYPKFAE